MLLYNPVKLAKFDIILSYSPPIQPLNFQLLPYFLRQLLNKLHLSSVNRAVDHHHRSHSAVLPQSPVNQGCFSRLGRAIDDVGLADDPPVYFLGGGPSERNHPLIVVLDLAKSKDKFFHGISNEGFLSLREGEVGFLEFLLGLALGPAFFIF